MVHLSCLLRASWVSAWCWWSIGFYAFPHRGLLTVILGLSANPEGPGKCSPLSITSCESFHLLPVFGSTAPAVRMQLHMSYSRSLHNHFQIMLCAFTNWLFWMAILKLCTVLLRTGMLFSNYSLWFYKPIIPGWYHRHILSYMVSSIVILNEIWLL